MTKRSFLAGAAHTKMNTNLAGREPHKTLDDYYSMKQFNLANKN